MTLNISQLTSNAALQRLQSDGLSSLGLTMLSLAPRWSMVAAPGTPSYSSSDLTLTVNQLTAPFLGIEEWLGRGDEFTDAAGSPITVPVAVLRLHPQAALRLERLAMVRYTTGGGSLVHPIPAALVVRLTAPVDRTPQRLEAGDLLTEIPTTATFSFHDRRGLIICPIAVAAMFNDMWSALAGLQKTGAAGAITDTSGLQSITGLANGNLVQLADLHGGLFTTMGTDAFLQVTEESGGTVTVVSNADTGYVQLTTDQRLQSVATSGNRLRWGFATNGVLSQTPLTLPALPSSSLSPPFASTAGPSLTRQFFRVFVVDATWHLLGNRSNSEVRGIQGDDLSTPLDLIPQVRDRVAIDYLADGPDTMAAISQVVTRFTTAGTGLVVSCSPTFAAVGLPPIPGPSSHWPAFPANGNATFAPNTPSPATGIAANWVNSTSSDIVVTIAANAASVGAHIRIYPRRFVEIAGIGPEPSFVRDNGGAAIAGGTNPTPILVPNPFGMSLGDAQPSPAILVMDIVITPRSGKRRLFGGISTPVAAGPVTVPADTFGGTDMLAAIPLNVRGICEVPLFGIPRTTPPATGSPSTIVALVRSLASESTPRTGPRLPMQGRFETIIATGLADPGAANGASSWEAVCTGARWAPESRSSAHSDANPGNPAGPDVHAASVKVTGQLAFDLAWHALRRARPALPMPGSPGGLDGWLLFAAGNNFNEPIAPTSDTGIGGVSQTCMGATLQTIAAICDTPELSLAPESSFTGTTTLQSIVNDLSSLIGISPPPTVNVTNADRQLAQVRREYWVAKKGRRDALWSLRRAIGEARELVYIEGAQFARTAASGDTAAHAIDLVQALIDRMTAHHGLRLVVAVPKQTDMNLKFGGWVRQALKFRSDAVLSFTSSAALKDRIAVFHPVGFPGRAAAIRTSVVIVDDVYSLVGTSHIRRRGMTFDGAADVVSFDRTIEDGYSQRLRAFRRTLMAKRLGVPIAAGAADSTAEWVHLERPRSAFSLVKDMLAQGGLGKIEPLWEGPSDTTVLAQSMDIADPDGATGINFLTLFASLLTPDA